MLTLNTGVPVDVMEQELIACEGLISRLRARQTVLLRQLDTAQVAQLDGSRSMIEWTAARLDIRHDAAGGLNQAAKLFAEYPHVAAAVAEGNLGFERGLATAKLAATGAPDDVVAGSDRFDLAGVYRLAARHRRVTRRGERDAFLGRFVATQPSLDGTTGRLWGELPGFEFRIFEKALQQRSDQFRDLPGPAPAAGARRADALVSMAQDSLEPINIDDPTRSRRRSEPLVSVFVDAELAATTDGEAGGEVEFGPRIGPATLERILCGGTVQVIGVEGAQQIASSHATRTLPPALRRFVLWRDGGCTIDGCSSRCRLEPHHVRPWSEGGSHESDNLTTLCWYHHHVVIHGEGRDLDPDSPPQRRRFIRARPREPEPG